MDDIHISVNYEEIILCDLIGRGSFWDVRKGIWRTNGQEKEVAVKTINGYFEENVLRKIQKQKKFIHPNIVQLYGVSKDFSTNICLIFEFADCGTLYNFLHHSDVDVTFDTKLDWMLQCAKGVEYLHRNQIILLDLKTRNLMLFKKFRVLKICGYKIAKINSELVGTIRYTAPEIFITNGAANKNCDVYSFGIIFWEVMSRKKPFYEDGDMHMLAIQNKINHGLRPNINDANIHDESGCIGHIIEKCWDQVPENRPTMQEICVLLPMNPLANTNVDFKEIQLGELIGHGSYGIIHKAIWKLIGAENRSVAVQIIQNRSQSSVQFQNDVYNEIQNLRKCIHRNIVTLYGASKDLSNNIYLLLEYTDCGSLYDFLHHSLKEVSFNVKLDWMLQCATGLEFLHKNNTIHRDLKTKNLLLFNEYRTLKICDFGRVKEFANYSSDLMESVCYMAPEVCVNFSQNENGKYYKMCDVFSFGITFWEVLSRKKPFYEYNNVPSVVIIKKIIDGFRPKISDANINDGSGYIELIIQKCWDRLPKNRLTMKELCALLPIFPICLLDIGIVNLEEVQLGKFIGRGNSGVVHKAIWKLPDADEKSIAVKIIQYHNVDSITENIIFAKNVFREIQIIKKCIHRNIIALYGVSKTPDNRFYLLLEYADCGSLQNFLHYSNENVSFKKKMDWMLQCATGIEFLHSKNIVHRNLTTHNLLLMNNYHTLKICDVGTMSKLSTSYTEHIGTIRYMAPEVCNSNDKYTKMCNVFSFGIIFWEVMSRKKPFEEFININPLDLQRKIINGDRPNINELNIFKYSNRIKSFIEKCWNHDPKIRPTTDQLFNFFKNTELHNCEL
ncbi:tyrosine-protein kinase JAK2-like isoform X3 [Drosophila sulfurigaster albostrigata]|uniref:tyrosine-protein kinase JAK2-like isoform X3 n=1 Tax=Drosophila sulfurigaster albostrigata TaxID=89887 RepID=UPI002D21EC31|nr:tyrosine-protein kinase JAK2-like isoform X3 [Drosophila sulfurigaster albostrigata]